MRLVLSMIAVLMIFLSGFSVGDVLVKNPGNPLPWLAMDYADFGQTQVMNGGQSGLVILLTDTQSRLQAEEAARKISDAGLVVALVDLDSYFSRIKPQHLTCVDTVTLLDVYAQFVQQSLQFDHFSRPALIGFGSAASYVKLVLAQAPAGIFVGGVSVHNDVQLLLPAAPCGSIAQKLHWKSDASTLELPSDLHLETPWFEAVSTAQLVNVLHDWLQRPPPISTSSMASVDDLPLIELPQTGGSKAPYFAIVISGDGGWANIDKDIAGELGKLGIAVVGWNSLRYFWEEKSPEKMADDLARVIAYHQRIWDKSGVLLVGFSLGADVLPFMVSRLPEKLRSGVRGIVLLSPSQSVDFQFHISNWLGTDSASSHDLLPEMAKIRETPLLCVYGENDDPTLCQLMKASPGVRIAHLPGDHHFEGDYAAVMQLLLAEFPVAP